MKNEANELECGCVIETNKEFKVHQLLRFCKQALPVIQHQHEKVGERAGLFPLTVMSEVMSEHWGLPVGTNLTIRGHLLFNVGEV